MDITLPSGTLAKYVYYYNDSLESRNTIINVLAKQYELTGQQCERLHDLAMRWERGDKDAVTMVKADWNNI